jgi:uroporphyrinogen decarboxylase
MEKPVEINGKLIKPMRPRWKGTMTDRERFNRQMFYKSVDRCFNMEFGYWDENFTAWDLFIKNDIETNEEADILFNFDKIAGVSGRTWMLPPFPSIETGRTETTKFIQNGDGLLAEVPLDGHDTIPHYIKATVVTPDDWARAKEERFRLDDPGRVLDVNAIAAMHPDDRDYPLGIDCGSMIGKVRDMLTFEGLAYAVYDYPDMVEDMVETACRLVEHSLDQLLPRVRFDFASGWEDICFKNGPIVSVPFFRDVVMPRYKRIRAMLDAHGIELWYIDCDGDVRPILPYMMEGGVNCLFPFEVNGCAHPGELLDEYGGQLRIMGGVDKIQLGKGKDAIDAYMKSLEKYVAAGGFIPFCDHRCPPNVSTADYIYYLDLKERMFG